jgi:hypothetical protein
MMILLFLVAQSVAANWDTPQLFTELTKANIKLQPVLRQIHPNEWKGAPANSQALWESSVHANQALQTEVAAVAKTPDNLAESLRLLEQVRDFNESVLQLSSADLIDGMLTEGKPARDAYVQRVLDLAQQREEQFQVADHEAQRCRELLSKQPIKR